MTLPASGGISMNQVNVELGAAGTTTRGLGDAAVRGLAGVASGAIAFSNLHGKSNIVNFSGNVFAEDTLSPYGATTASFRLNTDGTITTVASPELFEDLATKAWYSPTTAGIGTGKWVYVTNGGSANIGTFNTWLELTSNLTWGISRGTVGGSSDTITVQFANSSGGAVIATRTVAVSASNGV